MNALIITLFIFICCGIASYFISYDPISCSVDGAAIEEVNGFYVAMGGMYVKRGVAVDYHPDIFGIIQLKRMLPSKAGDIITMSPSGRGGWVIDKNVHKYVIYEVLASEGYKYIDQPPPNHWRAKHARGDSPQRTPRKKETGIVAAVEFVRPPTIGNCVGSLQNSGPINRNTNSNIGQLLQRPVTTLILGIILWVAYWLWSRRVEVSDVSYSYDKCFLQQQYWRGITASFSHFDLMHLGFNCMALYSLGELEMVYSSMIFLYSSANLVIITMVICTIIYHVLITRYGRHDLISQQAVGYSCVLFAWMVALSARLREYCPIFLFPSFCIDTWFLPLPISSWASKWGLPTALPINLGPFVLLFVTKLLIPRSSFIGHLSGIIIGYPLAWNMLNSLTPPSMLALLTASWMIVESVYWTPHWPGYETAHETNISEFVSPIQLRAYQVLSYCVYLLAIFVAPAAIFSMGVGQLLPRTVIVVLLWNTVQAIRVQWCTNVTAVMDQTASLLLASIGYLLAMTLYDFCNVVSAITARGLLLGCSLSLEMLSTHTILSVFSIIIQWIALICVVMIAIEVKAAAQPLLYLRLDKASVQNDLKTLHLTCCYRSGVSSFSDGRGHRLQEPTGQSSTTRNTRSNNPRSETISLPPLGTVRTPSSPVSTVSKNSIHI